MKRGAAVSLLLLLAAPGEAGADPGTVTDVGGLVASGPETRAAESLIGVDEPTGAATATIPVVLPPGRGGVVPVLGLHYDSNRDAADAGMGWSLGLPYILRRSRTETIVPGDWFFNDAALVLVCIVGSNGCPGNEPAFPSWAYGLMYFRPQVDATWTRFFIDPNFAGNWRVQLTDGRTQEYAKSEASATNIYRLTTEWDAQGGVVSPNRVV